MNFPVIVKDTLGAGSIGVEVMNSYEEVESFLNSDRNNSDIMVEELLNMAQSLKFEGTVQVDLVYRAGEWYIIEINPRWSEMTTTTAAMEGRNPLSIFVDSILGTDKNYSIKRNLKYALNFKMKARSQEDLIRLYGNRMWIILCSWKPQWQVWRRSTIVRLLSAPIRKKKIF